jgi:hypothetical protein
MQNKVPWTGAQGRLVKDDQSSIQLFLFPINHLFNNRRHNSSTKSTADNNYHRWINSLCPMRRSIHPRGRLLRPVKQVRQHPTIHSSRCSRFCRLPANRLWLLTAVENYLHIFFRTSRFVYIVSNLSDVYMINIKVFASSLWCEYQAKPAQNVRRNRTRTKK